MMVNTINRNRNMQLIIYWLVSIGLSGHDQPPKILVGVFTRINFMSLEVKARGM